MYETPAPTTVFYRVTDLNQAWPQILQGRGAYFSDGGRYNHTHQPTLYTSDDPLVAITEMAYYAALRHQAALGGGLPVNPTTFPFRSEHYLWAFTLTSPPQILDLQHPHAVQQHRYPPSVLFNPGRSYETTQDLADEVRSFPSPARPMARGLKAPSVRTPTARGYQPVQHVFFPGDVGFAGDLVDQWTLTIEFLDPQRRPVGETSAEIDWRRPRFRLARSGAPIAAHGSRPGARPYRPGRWHRIGIRYA